MVLIKETLIMTEAQLTARRKNAELSAGPRTPEGRKRSSLNAFRHGLTGQIIVHTPEDQEAFNKHCDGIREALAPEGALEIDLAQAIAEDRWRLNRARAIENSIFALGQSEYGPEDPDNPDVDAALAQGLTWIAHAHELALLSTYENRIRRSVEKNTAELRHLQYQRKSDAAIAKSREEAALIDKLMRSKGKDHKTAGDAPGATPDSSVRSFKGPEPEPQDPAWEPATPDSSVRSFEGHPASDPLEPKRFLEKSAAPLPEPAAQPSQQERTANALCALTEEPTANALCAPTKAPSQRVSPRPIAKEPTPTPWEPKPWEWVRNR
jgi:hypothetical protein